MSNDTLTQAEYSRLKSRLTFRQNKLKAAKKSGDTAGVKHSARQVISEVHYAFGIFQSKGYPDQWANWERAKEDAELAERLSGGGGL